MQQDMKEQCTVVQHANVFPGLADVDLGQQVTSHTYYAPSYCTWMICVACCDRSTVTSVQAPETRTVASSHRKADS